MDKTLQNSIPLTRIQKLIGERMLASKRTKPCFYLESKADVTELMAMRHELKKATGVKITSNAFYIRAAAIAVKKYPVMAGRFDNDHITIADAVNVGFAVSAPQGLVVPVIKNADEKTLVQIAEEEKILTDKARSNKLTLEDIKDETVAVSNLGVYGIDSFFGIVPPPASTILDLGNVIPAVVPLGGKTAVRKIVSLTLAVDHRVINGVYAAEFLAHIVELLQEPKQLI